jgi:hypothetical protein
VVVRKGSLDGLVEQVGDRELLELALADYGVSSRREHCSRKDYVAGYVALARRIRSDPQVLQKLLGSRLTAVA